MLNIYIYIYISMGHGLFGGEESERGDIKLNREHLGKHLITVLQNCNYVFVRCWE